MKKVDVKVNAGLDARLLAEFVQTAGKFESKSEVSVGGRIVNAKSIMGIMSVGIADGLDVTIKAEGTDEEDAVNELRNFLAG